MQKPSRTVILIAAAALAVPLAGTAIAQIVTADVNFPRGATSTTVAGTIAGSQTRDYVVRANAGQVMRVTLSGAPIVYFNVLPPGSNDAAIFTGSSEGNTFSGTLSTSGAYKLRVYQMRASGRRGETGSFRLAIAVTGKPQSGGAGAGAAGTGAPITAGNRPAYCRGEVAGMYGTRPAYVKTGTPAGAPAGGIYIDGTVDKGSEGIKEFRCRFDRAGRFIDVMAMTPDGE